jgi:hypothetical protein
MTGRGANLVALFSREQLALWSRFATAAAALGVLSFRQTVEIPALASESAVYGRPSDSEPPNFAMRATGGNSTSLASNEVPPPAAVTGPERLVDTRVPKPELVSPNSSARNQQDVPPQSFVQAASPVAATPGSSSKTAARGWPKTANTVIAPRASADVVREQRMVPEASPGISAAVTASLASPRTQGPHPSPLAPADATALLSRGDAVLALGDIASAKAFYERAAEAKNGEAALRLGETYDPVVIGATLAPAPCRAFLCLWLYSNISRFDSAAFRRHSSYRLLCRFWIVGSEDPIAGCELPTDADDIGRLSHKDTLDHALNMAPSRATRRRGSGRGWRKSN